MMLDAAGPEAVRVLVLGAGVVGVTTAARLVRCGAAVTLVAEAFGSNTAGVAAAPAWDWPRPAEAERSPDLERWAMQTYRDMIALSRGPTGIDWRHTYLHLDRATDRDPAETRSRERLTDMVTNVVPIDVTVSARRHRPRLTSTYEFSAPVIDPARYVRSLTARLVDDGVHIRRLRVADLSALMDLARTHRADAVINCAGAGATAFTDDPLLGVSDVVHLELRTERPPPERRRAVFRDVGDHTITLSATPVSGGVVLGMTTTAPGRPADPLEILDRCATVLDLPDHLLRAPLERRAGTVSVRPGGGLVDIVPGDTPLVHNYGHGAGSLSVVWGAARAAAALALGGTDRRVAALHASA